jgi:hypothetical protein
MSGKRVHLHKRGDYTVLCEQTSPGIYYTDKVPGDILCRPCMKIYNAWLKTTYEGQAMLQISVPDLQRLAYDNAFAVNTGSRFT